VRVVGQDRQQLVGGADLYRPACTRCYHDCNAGRMDGAAGGGGGGGGAPGKH